MRALIFFLASPIGRLLRMVTGFILVMVSWLAMVGIPSYIVLAMGAVMMAASFADVCLLAPLIGLSISDELLRDQAARHGHSRSR